MPETAGPPDAQSKQEQVGSLEFIQWLTACVTAYTQNPWDNAVQDNLRRARSLLTEFFLGAQEETLKQLFSNQLAKLHLSMAGSGLRDFPLSTEEQSSFDRVLSTFTGKSKQNVPPGHILAAMLYCRPDHTIASFLDRQIPDWLYGVFTAFLVIEPIFFDDATAFRNYCAFSKRVIQYVRNVVSEGFDTTSGLGSKARVTALTFTTFSSPIHHYFGDGNLKDFSENRAYILEQNARATGLQLGYTPPPRPVDRKKIRIGILKPHFSSQTETFATLPVFEHLDRKQFEIYLYAIEAARNDLERYCASRVDRMLLLPRNPREQATTIRGERLDILFFGSNLTAGVDACTTLALHRLAPVQMTSICCPITTGFTNMDYYVAGDLLAPRNGMQSQFREKLVNIPGSGICFSFGPEQTSATKNSDRQLLGIPADAVMFISGANYFKITPEVREAWATIISRVPGSVLVLYPFNPNWSSRYNSEPFISDINKRFARLGLAAHRLKILDPLPGRTDIKALLRLADVYLDSYPYGGATSLVDTLEAGLPTVVIRGDTLRFRQAASMLQELSVPQLIADTEDSYIELACKLGTDTGLRQQLRDDIQMKMKKNPAFLDSQTYALKMALLFQTLHARKRL
jgi:predicted O-linked N-acetylglucosamine transferase (SPINDLY family)